MEDQLFMSHLISSFTVVKKRSLCNSGLLCFFILYSPAFRQPLSFPKEWHFVSKITEKKLEIYSFKTKPQQYIEIPFSLLFSKIPYSTTDTLQLEISTPNASHSSSPQGQRNLVHSFLTRKEGMCINPQTSKFLSFRKPTCPEQVTVTTAVLRNAMIICSLWQENSVVNTIHLCMKY